MFTYSKITLAICKSVTFAVLFALHSLPAFGQHENLLSNGSFEELDIGAWSVSPERTILTRNLDFVDGKRSLAFHHGQAPSTTRTGITFRVGDGDGDLKCLRTYLFSLNAKVSAGHGNVDLIARFKGESESEQSKRWNYYRIREWQKVQIKFTVPSDADSVELVCKFLNTKGKCSIDCAQLVEDSSLVQNGDFENDDAWVFYGNLPSNLHPNFGSRSLRIFGSENRSRWASQFVNLSSFVTVSDEPMFTVSANIKTVLRADWQPDPPLPDYPCNSVDTDSEVDPVPGSGAQIQVFCYSSGQLTRRLSMPFFKSRSKKFTEQKYSFLVPEGTDSLRIALRVFNSNLTAFFDNIRLTYEPAPSGIRVGSVGHLASSVEAPLPGSYFQIGGVTQTDLDEGISLVTNPNGEHFGKILWLPRDDYLFERIIVQPGLQIKSHCDSVLKRAPTEAGGFTGTFIRSDSSSLANRVADVVIEGGIYSAAEKKVQLDNNNLGSVVAISGDRVALRNLYVPQWSQTTRWQDNGAGDLAERPNSDFGAYFIGNDIYVYHNTVAGPGGNFGDGTGPGGIGFDGLHYFGGCRAHFMGNQIISGDDSIGLFTGTIPSNVNPCNGDVRLQFQYNRNIGQVEIYNNRLSSLAARAVACGLSRPRRAASDLTATVSDIRARNIVGRQSGGTSSLSVVANPRAPRMYFPGDVRPTAAEALDDPDLFPDRLPQVFAVKYEKMFLSIDVSRQSNGRPPQYGVRIYSEDIGSLQNITLSELRIVSTCSSPEECDWDFADRPKALLQIERAGLLNNIMVPDANNPDEFVSAGFEAVGLSNRNFEINVFDSVFLDGNQFFSIGYDVDSTEPMNATATDVNSIGLTNSFPDFLPNVWTLKPDGIHD